MIAETEVRVAPSAADDRAELTRLAARALRVDRAEIRGVSIVRRSIDSRKGAPDFVLKLRVWVGEDPRPEPVRRFAARDVRAAEPVIVVGSGPAGLFAALELIEAGLRPIVLERGRDVRGRRFDVARLCREGVVDPESNYCFGEGGAGTFSDGKLYTRATKRGDVERVLELLVEHGAPPDIRIDSRPHVGTNRLPGVVQALGRTIAACGGELRCATRMTDLVADAGRVGGVQIAGGERLRARAVVLATGHSARDVIALLDRRGLAILAKPFAIGVRVEHPQSLVDRIQYHCDQRPPGLPPAAYSKVVRVGERGVFSFCMCPGGVICPAATSPDEVVVNGWSPRSRGSRFANSGIVAEVQPSDLAPYAEYGPLAGTALQAAVEVAAARAGGGRQVAPAQRLVDFCQAKESADLPAVSYPPGAAAADLRAVLPDAIAEALREGLRLFGRAMPGWATNEAAVLAVESRTSSPVRIPRDPETLVHPQLGGLFPCGEGAGYAGGIVSAALDGIRCARAVARWLTA